MYWATCGTSSTMSRRVWSLGGIRRTIPRGSPLGHATRRSRSVVTRLGPRLGLDREQDRALAAGPEQPHARSRRPSTRRPARRPRRTRAARRPRPGAAGRAGPSAAPARPGRPPRRSSSGSTLLVAASCWADAVLVTIAPVSGSSRGHSRMIRPSNRARSSASGSQTSTTASPPGARWSAIAWRAARWAARGRQDEQRVEGDEREPETAGIGQAEPDDVRLDEGQPVLAGGSAGPRGARPVEHRRIEVDAGDEVARLGQRDGQPAGPDRQLEDRTVDPVGQREVQVEVARIVGQVEVVQPREGGRRSRRSGRSSDERSDGQPSQRTRCPASRAGRRAR